MCSSRRGGTKLLYHIGRGKLKGDTSVWSASHFWINARPLLPACLPLQWNERHTTSTCVSNTRKRETDYVPCTKISGSRSLSSHLAIFWLRALSRSVVALETATPLALPVVLNPNPEACRRLIPGPGARRRLIPGLTTCHRCCHPQALGHCHAATIDLNSASLRPCHHRWPQPRLPLSTLSPSSSTPTSLGIKP
jgi:hypothetical protein